MRGNFRQELTYFGLFCGALILISYGLRMVADAFGILAFAAVLVVTICGGLFVAAVIWVRVKFREGP